MRDLKKELNEEQLAVVEHGDGPCLVLAGAGSGKTRVITYRVAYLLEKGVKPENILLVTFTNKAAAEMVERVQKLTGSSERLPWSGTFHHIGHKLLRLHAEVLGYQKNFSILDTDDSEALVKLASKDYAVTSTKTKKFPTAAVLQGIISFSRNTERAMAEILEERYSQFMVWKEQIIAIAAEYEKRKKEANAMDFDDLLINTLRLLNDKKILEQYSKQFEYVLVDEYQDTNKTQATIVKKFASHHKNILVVGDDAQSIYSFRGADIVNILQFEKDFPKAKIFRLETNYRSSQEILSLANGVIAHNAKQYKKQLRTKIITGLKPELHPHADQTEEAGFITGKIATFLKQGIKPEEIAVLFRAAHHSQMLELELLRAGIDYDYRGGLRFFDRSHVKDVLAYLRLFNNLLDTTAWLRVLMFEDGIGPSSAAKIIEKIKLVENVEDLKTIGEFLPDKARTGWNHFLIIWDGMLGIGKTRPTELIKFIIDSPYREHLEAERVDSSDRIEDLKQLAIFAGKYDNLEEFLADAALQEAFKMQNEKKQKELARAGKVVLSTIHQSKGLEWSVVFVVNLAHGSFPHERALREDGGVEEERRLFYVAVTRAKKHLYLTFPMSNSRGAQNFSAGASSGWGETMYSEPSVFISEIDSDLLEDKTLLKTSTTFLNDVNAGVTYEPEEKPLKIRPGSFLKSLEDL